MVIRVTQILLFSILLFAGCAGNYDENNDQQSHRMSPQEAVEVKYARGFQIDTMNGFQRLRIIDSVNNETYEYLLVPKGLQAPDGMKVIQTPVESMSLFSVSFIAFLNELNALDKIKYVENINYVYNQEVHELYSQGVIAESGLFGQVNLEKLILDSPEVILLNGFSENSDQQKKLIKSGIQVFPILEWYEQNPLARAEWIKVFGALIDRESEANSIFNLIESEYKQVKEKCSGVDVKSKAIFSSLYQGVWYLPGGKSYVANLLKDANGTYSWMNDENTRSIAASFEEVILTSSKNDVWINPDANSIEELYARDDRYKKLVDNLTIGVFQSIARVNKNGGNDYWETGVVRPDLILKDYGKMLYPKQFKDVEFYFFKKLN